MTSTTFTYSDERGHAIHLTDNLQYATVLATLTGPVCGQCAKHGRRDINGAKIRHANSANVRACYARDVEMEADARAEMEAENAVERHYENRGYWETRAQENYERACGVIDPDYWN